MTQQKTPHQKPASRKRARKLQRTTITPPISPEEKPDEAFAEPIKTAIHVVDLENPTVAFTLAELKRGLQDIPTEFLVEGLLPAVGVHVLVGDSGIGKTPLAYQLGLCIAAGKPFLGHAVRPSRVLYCDLENGLEQIVQVTEALCAHLGVDSPHSNFRVASPNSDSLEQMVKDYKPDVVIVDTLRVLDPAAEEKNSYMGHFLKKLHEIGRKNNCTILLLHHIRKPSQSKGNVCSEEESLADTPALEWLHKAAGARALINQTTTRIAVESYEGNQLGHQHQAMAVLFFTISHCFLLFSSTLLRTYISRDVQRLAAMGFHRFNPNRYGHHVCSRDSERIRGLERRLGPRRNCSDCCIYKLFPVSTAASSRR